ncbi:MAG: hypothetical protein FWC75_06320 [Oscillospiraceae bacterium]|nr:hypothetical protein [Oscillospiraceae bacterium]
MSVIKNTITLDNQMSAALKEILADTKAVDEALNELPNVADEISDYFGLMSEQMSGLKESSAEAFEQMVENSEEVTEALIETKETIAEMTEIIHEKAEALDEVAESIEGVGKSSGNAAQGMRMMTQGANRMLGAFGLIPKEIGNAINGVSQLGRGIGAATTKSAKLVAMLGPITLIATAVMGIISVIRLMSSEVEDEALPAFDELLRRSESLTRESESLTEAIQANVYEMERLNAFGDIGTGLIDRLARENELLYEQARALRLVAEIKEIMAVEEVIGSLFEREAVVRVTVVEDDSLERAMHRIERTIEEGMRPIDRHQEKLNDLRNGYMEIADAGLHELVPSLVEQLAALKRGGEATAEYVDEVYELIRGFNDLMDSANEAARACTWYEDRIRIVGETTARVTAITNAFADASRRGMRHVARAYRDVDSLADSLRGSHSALSDAISAMNAGYAVTVGQFNEIMSMAPEMLNFLFDEYGALRDAEEAVYELTQAHMELAFYRQKNALLDLITVFDEEGNIMGVQMGVVDSLADSYRYLADMRLLALKAGVGEGSVTQADFDRVNAMIGSMRSMTESAQRSAREGGVGGRSGGGTVSTPRGRAALVSDPANAEIRGKIIRLKEDITRREFMGGAYQMPAPRITIGDLNVYATPGMNEEQLAQKVGQYACSMVAEQMRSAYRTDLARRS